jgi:ubiquinone/menaquinone biosynthesis C-methylase UbiE
VLDIGCGSGAITREIAEHSRAKVTAIDIDPAMVDEAIKSVDGVEWRVGDAHHLPFAEGQFDVVVCNFLLLWVRDPARVVGEMARVVRKGGVVLDTAEPDYGGRIDFPEDLPLGELMSQALKRLGADPFVGRKLRRFFVEAGLTAQDGIIASVWNKEQLVQEFDQEWRFLGRAVEGLVDSKTLRRCKQIEKRAIHAGWRFLFMPIFYALGVKG